MTRLAVALALAMVMAVSACSKSKFRSYDGPEVTRLSVYKSSRRMYLYHHDQVIKHYDIDLGFAPAGPKRFQGDGKTPEGRYYIDRRNPNSSFHLSLGISYPNPVDAALASKSGKSPGGDIFIHGMPNKGSLVRKSKSPDWTAGCISVKNREIEEIYAMVRTGTVIDIYP